jgi:hypothetical protein
MEEVAMDGLLSVRWTEEELELIKCLVDLKVPIDIIAEELERSLAPSGFSSWPN